jgi:uncharacterized protein (DUF111 family)
MTILAFEPFSGASGDMLTGCLIDLGANASDVRENMEAAADVEVQICEVQKSGIRAMRVNVIAHDGSRSYLELIDAIQSCGISSPILADASAIFGILAEAEAAVHGVHKDELVFHQVGAQDAVADVIGACTAISQLQVNSVFTAPICVGGGLWRLITDVCPYPLPRPLPYCPNTT